MKFTLNTIIEKKLTMNWKCSKRVVINHYKIIFQILILENDKKQWVDIEMANRALFCGIGLRRPVASGISHTICCLCRAFLKSISKLQNLKFCRVKLYI